MLKVEKDFEDFIELLNKNNVKYLIVDAYALALYAKTRNTGDIDIFFQCDDESEKSLLSVDTFFSYHRLFSQILTDFNPSYVWFTFFLQLLICT